MPQTAPAESFVLLQDSVIRTIPANIASPPSRMSPRRSKTSSTTAHLPPTSPATTTLAAVPSEPPEPAPLSHHLRSAQRLFTLLSARTELDHPLCAECTHVALRALERQLEETRKERDGYIAFEREIRKEKEREGRGGVVRIKEEMEKRVGLLRDEERLAIEQLKQAEREREQLEEEMRALDLEEKMLEEEEAEYAAPRICEQNVWKLTILCTGFGRPTTRVSCLHPNRLLSWQPLKPPMPPIPLLWSSWSGPMFITTLSVSVTTVSLVPLTASALVGCQVYLCVGLDRTFLP
jgi:hypothetical protein